MTTEEMMPDVSRETNEVLERLDKIATSLQRKPDAPYIQDLYDAVVFSAHVRLRVTHLVLTISAAGTVTISIGGVNRTFNFGVADTRAIPFPVVIERGTDVVLNASAGTCYGYLVTTGE